MRERLPLRARVFAPAREPLWTAVAAITCALALCFIAILASGKDPVAGYGWLVQAVGITDPLAAAPAYR